MLEKTANCLLKKAFIIGLILQCCFIQSCKKEVNKQWPNIDIFSPSENKVHFVPEAVLINAEVSDNEHIEYVRLAITNENYVSVAPVLTLNPDENPVSINQSIMVDDPFLISGDYYLVITASDGVNEKKEYRKIRLYEVERKFMGVVFSDDANNNQVDVYLVDTLYNKQLLATRSDDFGGSAISSRNQSYYLVGDVLGDMQSVALSSSGASWAVPSQPTPPAPYYTGVTAYDGRVYFSSFDKKIQGTGKQGNGILTIETGSYTPYAVHRQGDVIYSEQRQLQSGQQRLVQYYEGTGGYKKEISLDIEVVDFCERANDNVLLFGNQNNQGALRDYNPGDNSLWTPHTIPAGKILCATRVDENDFMIGHETGVLWYRYNSNSLVTFKAGVQAAGIQYNDVDNILIISSGSELKYYSFPSGNLIQTITHSSEIKGMEIFFNK